MLIRVHGNASRGRGKNNEIAPPSTAARSQLRALWRSELQRTEMLNIYREGLVW